MLNCHSKQLIVECGYGILTLLAVRDTVKISKANVCNQNKDVWIDDKYLQLKVLRMFNELFLVAEPCNCRPDIVF